VLVRIGLYVREAVGALAAGLWIVAPVGCVPVFEAGGAPAAEAAGTLTAGDDGNAADVVDAVMTV
jgi:hypothetical protein